MKASSQVVLIADSLCYDDPTVRVDTGKEYVLLFYIHITYISTYCHIRLRISAHKWIWPTLAT